MSPALTKVVRRLHNQLGRYLDRGIPALSPYGATQASFHANDTQALAFLMAGLGQQDTVEVLFMLETFLKVNMHLTAPIFSSLLKDRGHDISVDKAAGALEMFTSLGFAEKHHIEDDRIFYEPSHPGSHHDHIICSGCGRTTEFNKPNVDQLIEKIACDEDYAHLQHKLIIYGLCPSCRLRRHEGLPLAETKVGEAVMVVGFSGPLELTRRLVDLGLHRGVTLKILGEHSGSIIVLLGCCRLAMGPEMSAAVMVRSVERGDHGSHCKKYTQSASAER